MAIVPPLALFLLNNPIVNDYDLSSLRNATIGAAPVDENVTKAMQKKFPGIILQQGTMHILKCDFIHVDIIA